MLYYISSLSERRNIGVNGRTNSTSGNQPDIDVTKSPFATLPPSNITAVRGNQKIDLGWSNPVTEMATPGDYVVAKRAYTLLIRNDNHFPKDRYDGTILYTDTSTEDGSIGSYSDNGLTNGHMYYYGLVAVTDNEVPSDVATISMIPTMGVGYSGSIDDLSITRNSEYGNLFIGSTAAATADNQYAIFTAFMTGETDDYFIYINNINAYNVALVKQDIKIDYMLDDSAYPNSQNFVASLSFGKYALFTPTLSSYRNFFESIIAFNSSLTIVTPIPKFSEPCTYRRGWAFNNYACWYSSSRYDGQHTQWPRNFERLSESLTMDSINFTQYQIDGMVTSGLRTVGEFLCIGPGWSQNVSTHVDEYYRCANYISKDWTIQTIQSEFAPGYTDNHTFQQPNKTVTSNMLESTGTHILYSNGGSGIETIDENGTVGQTLTNPFSISTSSHWSHDEFVIIIATGAPGDCVAYDRYLTATYPSDVSQTHTNAAATSIQNHAIFGGVSNNYVDVYST